MSIYAIIYLVLVGVGLLISANRHGKIVSKEYNFWTTLVSSSIVLSLLYFGGFFESPVK
jgi:hypothetical protein